MSVASSLLSLARTSTSLFFQQRFGIDQETDPPLSMLAFVFPSILFMVSELAACCVLVGLFVDAYLGAFVYPTYLQLVYYSLAITSALFVHTVISAILIGLNCYYLKGFFTKVSIFSLRKGLQTSKKGLILRFLTTASCHLTIKCKIKYRGIRYGRDISRGIKCQQKLGQDGSGMSGWIGIGHFDLKNFQGKSAKVKYNPNFSRFFS